MRRLELLLTAALVLGTVASAVAADFSYTSKSPWGNADLNKELILLEGEIAPGDYKKLLALIARDPRRFLNYRGLVIASSGGDVREAIKLAKFVKAAYAQVMVGDTFGKCASACFLLLAAAPERAWIRGFVGVHRPFVNPATLQRMSVADADSYQAAAFREMRAFMESVDVPSSLIERMFSTSSLEIHWLGMPGEEISRLRPSFEQFLIARCNYDPRNHRKAIEQRDDSAKKELVASLNCGTRLTQNEAEAFVFRTLRTEK